MDDLYIYRITDAAYTYGIKEKIIIARYDIDALVYATTDKDSPFEWPIIAQKSPVKVGTFATIEE